MPTDEESGRYKRAKRNRGQEEDSGMTEASDSRMATTSGKQSTPDTQVPRGQTSSAPTTSQGDFTIGASSKRPAEKETDDMLSDIMNTLQLAQKARYQPASTDRNSLFASSLGVTSGSIAPTGKLRTASRKTKHTEPDRHDYQTDAKGKEAKDDDEGGYSRDPFH